MPRLGHVPLQRLTTARVGAFYGELVASGGQHGRPLSPKTVRYVHTTLRRALRDAVADGLVARNVAAQARAPRARRVELHTWTAVQVGTFLASVREDRLYPAWLLLATLGIRRGELLGLRWIDADLTTGRIAIRHTLVMVDGKPAMAEPKTAKGRRSLTLEPVVLDALRAHRTRQAAERLAWGADYTDSGLVITTEDGRPMHPETLSGLFVRQAKQAGLPQIRLHDLRHSVASILLARGVHPKVVSELLGHATIALTLDTYSHIIPSLQQEAASPPKGRSGPSRPVVDRTRTVWRPAAQGSPAAGCCLSGTSTLPAGAKDRDLVQQRWYYGVLVVPQIAAYLSGEQCPSLVSRKWTIILTSRPTSAW